MEFVSQAEYITTLLLIPVFSAGIFLTISFLEIFEKYGEIIFINKKHAYTNKDLIFPLIFAILIGFTFYLIFFVFTDMVQELPPIDKSQPCAEFGSSNLASNYTACINDYREKHKNWTIWDLF